MLEFANLAELQHITHGIYGKDEPWPEGVVMFERQMHGDRAIWVDAAMRVAPPADALVTRSANMGVGIRIADCASILFVEPRASIIGAIHAGWRGTALEITRKTLEQLKMPLQHVRVGIGPALCPKCLVVGEEVARQFSASCVQQSEIEEEKFHLDLWQANVDQCLEVGIPERNIEVMRICTFEDPSLYSFRRGDGQHRNLAYISQKQS